VLCRVTRQRDKRHAAGSKLVGSSPACGYQLAPDDDDSRRLSEDLTVDAGHRVAASERGIKLESYDRQAQRQGHSNDVQETSYIFVERPPVEGRDSLSKDVKVEGTHKPQHHLHATDGEFQSANYIPPSRSNVATVRELTRGSARPNVEPLALHASNGGAELLDSPESSSHDMSPFTKTRLFTDDRTQSPLSDIVADDNDVNVDLEYDDYLPQLPGSYFTMDPQAYTLTWSKQPQAWTHESVTFTHIDDSESNGDRNVDVIAE